MARRTPTREFEDETRPVTRGSEWSPERRGLFLGPLRITPVRVFLVLALVGSMAYVAYAILLVRDTSAMPMLSIGAVLLGFVFMALAVAGGKSVLEAGREGRGGGAFAAAFAGGIAAIVGFGCFAGAIILLLVMQGG